MSDNLTLAVTIGALVVFVVGLIAYDIWTLVKRGYETTISWNALYLSKKYPIIPYVIGGFIGVIAGHLWWPHGDCVK